MMTGGITWVNNNQVVVACPVVRATKTLEDQAIRTTREIKTTATQTKVTCNPTTIEMKTLSFCGSVHQRHLTPYGQATS